MKEKNYCTRCGQNNVFILYYDEDDDVILIKKRKRENKVDEFYYELRIMDGNYNTSHANLYLDDLKNLCKQIELFIAGDENNA